MKWRFIMSKPERFTYRYKNTMNPRYNRLLELENLYFAQGKQPNMQEKDNFCLAIKYAYETSWKTMKDFLKMKGKNVLLPRKIFQEMGEYFDTSIWIYLIDEINLFFANRKDEKVLDNMIMHYFSHYSEMFDRFLHFITNQEYLIAPPTEENSDNIPQNYSILDTYTLVTLVNYFLTKPSIELVRVYGSRANSTYRSSSDVDLIVSGSFTEEDFPKLKADIENLPVPYIIDIENGNATSPRSLTYLAENIPYSVILYDKKDFIKV